MATYLTEPSRTFNEYLLIPRLTTKDCTPDKISLRTPLVKHKVGEEAEMYLNVPFTSAIMQAVSGEEMGVALAREGGLAFIYMSQSVESQAAMVRHVKESKSGFVRSKWNLKPHDTLRDILEIKEESDHSTIPVTEDGTARGKLLGIITSKDYRLSRDSLDKKVEDIMTPVDKLVYAKVGLTLSEANDIIWEKKINCLPVIEENGNLNSLVFRKDYEQHKENPLALQDKNQSYLVGAGVNTRDYEERIPALVEAGVDILCLDSSDGFSVWQKEVIEWVHEKYNGKIKIGAGNVVSQEAFYYLADAGADFIKIGIGGGSICITRETKGIGRGQETSLIEKLTKLLRPIMKCLFPNLKDKDTANKEISMNLIANILGLGNAATPLGLKAMKTMQKENGKKDTLSNSMAMFIVLNTASLQLVPTTVIAIRSSLGSENPSSIILPIWIVSIITVVTGVCITKILMKKF